MSTEKPPRRALGIYTRRSGTGMLVETYHDGYLLNETATFLWSLVGTGRTVAELTAAFAQRYELSAEQASECTTGFLAELASRGFLDS